MRTDGKRRENEKVEGGDLGGSGNEIRGDERQTQRFALRWAGSLIYKGWVKTRIYCRPVASYIYNLYVISFRIYSSKIIYIMYFYKF